MKQSIHILQNIETLSAYLASQEIGDAAKSACSILVQIYSVVMDPKLAIEVVSLIETELSQAVVVGTSTVGEVAFGKTHTVSTLIVFSFFRSTRLSVVAQTCPTGEEYATGRRLGARIRDDVPEVSGVLLLATPLSFDMNPLLKGLGQTLGDCVVFGGGAGDYAAMVQSWVLHGRSLFDQGLVAVAMAGEHLQITAQTCLGWRPLGREMTVTGIDGMRITSIDYQPALEVYRRYINVEKLEDFGLISAEFPFLFNTDNGIVARVPIATGTDGALVFMANIEVGEKFRIGYGDPQEMLDTTGDIHRAMRTFAPEGILVFSCGCRRYLMQEDVERETLPFETIATTAGFYTYGEFFGTGPTLQLLNAALLAVGLRETCTAASKPHQRKEEKEQECTRTTLASPHDPYAQQHSRVLSSLLRFIGSVTDELEQANANLVNLTDKLRQSQELFNLVADHSADVIWLLDSLPHPRFRYVSPSVARVWGRLPTELTAQPLKNILGPAMNLRVRTLLFDALEKLQAGDDSARFIHVEVELPHGNGSMVTMDVTATILLDAQHRPHQVLGIGRDITERKAAEEAIRHMAFCDLLTGLPNRRLLEDRLHQSLARAHRDALQLALLFIDLDKFKAVNDDLGHEAGDALLRQVAGRLLQCLRESDTVARIGGDEFIVLLPDIGAVQDAIDVAEKIRAALENPFTLDASHAVRISSSIGVVVYPEHATEARDLLRMGDEAMYLAKKGGRNAVELHAPVVPPASTEESTRMQFIVWKPAFACGYPTIDAEHQALFRRANTLIELAYRNPPDLAAFNLAFDDFLLLIQEHFTHEESILRALGYAGLEQHTQLHRVLLENACTLREEVDASGIPRIHIPMRKVVEFLVNEVAVGHLLQTDSAYFPLLEPPAPNPG